VGCFPVGGVYHPRRGLNKALPSYTTRSLVARVSATA